MSPSDDYEPRENDELVEPFLAGLRSVKSGDDPIEEHPRRWRKILTIVRSRIRYFRKGLRRTKD